MNKKPLILSVEDKQTQQDVIRLLAEKFGYEVHAVSSGLEALEALACSSAYQFILMDWFMYDMDGFECTKRIRELEAGTDRHIPILAVTAHAERGDREKCLAAGMDDYLSKPFTAEDFGALLRTWTKPTTSTLRLVRPPRAQSEESNS